MSIDIERLKVDREYWDSVAPEGATHAHYVHNSPGAEFYNSNTGMVWRPSCAQWKPRVCTIEALYTEIPRPSPAWNGEGLPPIGSKCTIEDNGRLEYGADHAGRPLEVVAHVEDCAVLRLDWGLGCFDCTVLRPLRTEKERVVEAATEFFTKRGFCPNKHDLGAAYEAGLLRMPEKSA